MKNMMVVVVMMMMMMMTMKMMAMTIGCTISKVLDTVQFVRYVPIFWRNLLPLQGIKMN